MFTNLALSLLLLALVSVSHTRSEQTASYASRQPLRGRVVAAMTSAVEYMRDNFKQLNLDAITGLRIVQAQLEELQTKAGSSDTSELLSLVLDTIKVALPEVSSYDSAYYNKLKRLTDADFWPGVVEMSQQRMRESESEFISAVLDLIPFSGSNKQSADSTVELFDEDSSDRCIQETFDTRCNISQSCLHMMTATDVRGYTATHQLYYFLILSQSKCLPASSQQGIVKDIKMQLCSNIYMEVKSEPTHTDIQQDLFMEQVGLCGLAGYFHQFSRTDWVERILQWQKPAGCYGQVDNFLRELMLLDEKQRFRRAVNRRVRREERIMPDGCLCHRTTVALMALVQNYRSLVQPSRL